MLLPLRAPALDEVMTTLREVVAEKGPEFIYTNPDGDQAGTPSYIEDVDGEKVASTATCFYVHGDQPGCIAGYVLNRLGVPLYALKSFEGNGVAGVAKEAFGLDFYDPAVRALEEAQTAQDSGKTWGEALAASEKRVLATQESQS